jgi:hypothetical protein
VEPRTFKMPEGFDNLLNIQNAKERFLEAEEVAKRLSEGGIALKPNADHYAIFTDPPRLVADPLKRVGYVLGYDNRCYPSPVDGCDYINVAASLPASSPAREKGWCDHVAVVHPVDEAGYLRMMEQGYGNPFIHHITWGIEPHLQPVPEGSELAAALVSTMAQVRQRVAEILGAVPGTLILALPGDIVESPGFGERFGQWIGNTPNDQVQLEVMQGGGYLLQFFVLKGGRIELALRFRTTQTFNPKSVHKISRDELSVDQGQEGSVLRQATRSP